MVSSADRLIIAFDGECLLCSRCVRWVAARDTADRIRFVPLQDPRGEELRQRAGLDSMESMVVEHRNLVFVRSEAVFEILGVLGAPWPVAARVARWVPQGWRDRFYDAIATHRHRWFGRGDACGLASEALRSRLL